MQVELKRIWLAALAIAAALGMSRPAGGAPPAHLVPFPEDAAEQAAQPKPVKPAPPKSDFQPRFRPPNVKPGESLQPNHPVVQASAVEPSAANEPVAEAMDDVETESAPAALPAPAETVEGPQLLPATEPADPNSLSGRAALNEAFQRSKSASSETDYTAIIALCERGKVGVEKPHQQYADQLMGWAYNRRGELRAREGDDTQAMADFETAVRLNGAWRAIHNRGVSYAAAGKMTEALADFERTIQLNPRYPNAYYNRGELRYREGDYPGAIDDYTMSLKLGGADAATYNSRGHAFYRIQRFGDALRDYGEAIKLDPTNPDPLINRGDTHSDLGQYGEAAADYRAAVQISPENGRAFQAAAWLMATCPDAHYRDDKLAVDAARRAIELDGETYRNLSTLAAAQASSGDFATAKATQERAIAAATKEQVLTGEKMMSLYQRELAFRDRPITAYETPEETDEKAIRQAAASELMDKISPLPNRRAEHQVPAEGLMPQRGGSQAMPPRTAAQPPGRYSAPQEMPRQLPQTRPAPQQYQRQPAPPQQPAPRTRLFGPKGSI